MRERWTHTGEKKSHFGSCQFSITSKQPKPSLTVSACALINVSIAIRYESASECRVRCETSTFLSALRLNANDSGNTMCHDQHANARPSQRALTVLPAKPLSSKCYDSPKHWFRNICWDAQRALVYGNVSHMKTQQKWQHSLSFLCNLWNVLLVAYCIIMSLKCIILFWRPVKSACHRVPGGPVPVDSVKVFGGVCWLLVCKNSSIIRNAPRIVTGSQGKIAVCWSVLSVTI